MQVQWESRRERRRLSNMTSHGRRTKESLSAQVRAEVVLLALEGRSDQDIAAQTGVAPKQVRGIREEPTEGLLGIPSMVMPRDTPDRAWTAKEALKRPFLSVSNDEEVQQDGFTGIGFWDPVAADFPELVDQTVEVVLGCTGVSQAFREDKDLIVIQGSDMDLKAIEGELLAWWRSRLLKELES